MSKQYLTVHTLDNAHPSQIFSLAPTRDGLFSASGSATIAQHATAPPTAPPLPSIPSAHRAGCHHLASSRDGPGKVLVSAGFGHDAKVWVRSDDNGVSWREHGIVDPWGGAAHVWAVALSADEQFVACSSDTGKVAVWDVVAGSAAHLYETAAEGQGSFGVSVDISPDGRMAASGHENGTVYVFNNVSGRLIYSLTGLSKPIRSVRFSPGGTRLAASGDAGIIAVYDTRNGEHVGNLSPAGASQPWIMSLDWSHTGEYLLSGSFDGRVRVWSVETGACVAVHSEGDQTVWAVRWLPKPAAKPRAAEAFVAAGAAGSITFYREASGNV